MAVRQLDRDRRPGPRVVGGPAPAAAAALDDAHLKTRVVELLADPRTEAAIAEALEMDVHALGFALKRLARSRVITPTWIDGVKAWRRMREDARQKTEAAPDVDDEMGKEDAMSVHARGTLDPLDVLEDVDDELDGLEDEDEDEEEIPEMPPPPPLRSKAYQPGHRVARKPVAPAGPSPWERPREGFTQAQAQRAAEIGGTRQARMVTGRVNE